MSFVGAYQEMRKIYGFCPCCDEPFRLSDVELFLRARPPVTDFDRMHAAVERLNRKIERFDEKEQQIREKAKDLGRRAARRRIRAIAPFLRVQEIEPADVKVLFDPVEYVVFRNLRDRACSAVDFVDHPPESKARELVIKSIQDTLRAGNIEWHTYRVSDDGNIVREN